MVTNLMIQIINFFDNDTKFIKILLESINLKKYEVGGTVPTLNRNHVHPIKVAVPPLKEQNEIALVYNLLENNIQDILHLD